MFKCHSSNLIIFFTIIKLLEKLYHFTAIVFFQLMKNFYFTLDCYAFLMISRNKSINI